MSVIVMIYGSRGRPIGPPAARRDPVHFAAGVRSAAGGKSPRTPFSYPLLCFGFGRALTRRLPDASSSSLRSQSLRATAARG